jgi:hypothetical protein
MRIEWTAKALSNLEEILSFIAEDRPGAAEKVAQKFKNRFLCWPINLEWGVWAESPGLVSW